MHITSDDVTFGCSNYSFDYPQLGGGSERDEAERRRESPSTRWIFRNTIRHCRAHRTLYTAERNETVRDNIDHTEMR